ncbi:unnamed protein product [Anisakis simplex]|uniref:HTH_7 domain-containing protein n=1 Tax=Anisakis simplex TaxID=6269 RepID=A0A0M3KB81_ANISI|nr:unnamed protein product [Anisakis simplex]
MKFKREAQAPHPKTAERAARAAGLPAAQHRKFAAGTPSRANGTGYRSLPRCRLAGCSRPNQPFKTVKAWKIHVQRAACHREQTLCTSCGHNVALPSSAHLSAAEIKTVMDAHKAERCVGVTKRALVARKIAAERLVTLGRDVSHIAILDEDAEEVQVPSNPRKRHLASEAAWRADQCCLYLKRFKADHPDLMEQIGMEHQLTIG